MQEKHEQENVRYNFTVYKLSRLSCIRDIYALSDKPVDFNNDN
jgi:hypothetical protein